MSWISKLLGGRPDAAPEEAADKDLRIMLEVDFALASKTHADVAPQLVRYILTGAGAETLEALRPKIDSDFRRLCASYGTIETPPAMLPRGLFFFRNAGRDIDLTVRYLRVLHLCSYANSSRLSHGTWAQQQSFARQMLILAFNTSQVANKTVPDEEMPPVGMTRATVFAIARAVGASDADMTAVMTFYAVSLITPRVDYPLFKRRADAIGFADDFLNRPNEIRTALDEMHYMGATIVQVLDKLGAKDHPIYTAYIADHLFAKDKNERGQATSNLRSLPVETRERLLIERLGASDAKLREDVATLLIGSGLPGADAALKARLEVERAGAVRRLIEAHFAGQAMQEVVEVADDDNGYTAIGGVRIDIPPVKDFIVKDRPVFGEVERQELVALIETANAKQQAAYEERTRTNAKYNYVPRLIDPANADHLIAKLNGKKPDQPLPHSSEFYSLLGEAASTWYRRQLLRLPQEIGLREFVGDNLAYLSIYSVHHTPMISYLQAPNLDLRRLEALIMETTRGAPKGKLLANLIGTNRGYHHDKIGDFPREAVWPLVAANLHVIDDAFSTAPKLFHNLLRKSVIAWLGLLPATPQRFLAPLLEIATSPRRESRAEARQLLANAPGIDAHLIALLEDSKADTRRVAAEWLAERRVAEAEPALRDRLKKEKTEAVRAAMITALDRVGADISAFAGPIALLKEAEAGMKGAGPLVPVWLGLDALGPLRWRDGKALPDTVLHWWIRLAIKLKQPGGNGMFALYLDQIHPEDSLSLGRLILDSWTAECLRTRIENDKWRGSFEVLDNDAPETKGILALARGVLPSHAAAKVRWFLKTHGRMSNQSSALLELLAAKGDPQSLQVVLAAANRQKQKSVQKLAGDLVARIAEDNDWSLDQLADRTVPTLGLDDAGRLELPCGDDRTYVAQLDEALDLVLFNPDGRQVKALPTGEDDATVEAKATFADAKKTLTQAVTMQRDRLFDAMCSGRVWPAGDWLTDIHGHPVLRKMAQQLVWLGLNPEGEVLSAFRPTPEGDFIGADDAARVPGDYAAIRLAHSMLVSPEDDKAWAAHLADHEVKPLFAQFGRRTVGTVAEDADAVDDRLGWVTDTFTVRGLAKKLGYDRGAAGDGGHFDHYLRRFPAAGLVAMITFSGNCLPEENLPAVIHTLKFARDRDGKPGGGVMPAKVPPVLLSECWQDYHAAASKGAFDPEWEKRSPW